MPHVETSRPGEFGQPFGVLQPNIHKIWDAYGDGTLSNISFSQAAMFEKHEADEAAAAAEYQAEVDQKVPVEIEAYKRAQALEDQLPASAAATEIPLPEAPPASEAEVVAFFKGDEATPGNPLLTPASLEEYLAFRGAQRASRQRAA